MTETPTQSEQELLEKSEILIWRNKYDREEDLQAKGVEETLGAKMRKAGYLTKADLETIVKWKFQGRLVGRQKRTLNFLGTVNENIVKETTSLAFQTKDDETRLGLLSQIKGVGNALGSVILAFYDPQNYGVLDIHAWRELFGKEPNDIFSNPRQGVRFFERLRQISQESGFSCRDVEKAIFKRNLETGKSK